MDYSILAGSVAAQILWLQGLLDQSDRAGRDVLADAQAGGHPASLCQALSWCGCSLSLRRGDLDVAERSIALLKDVAENNGLSSYYAIGLGNEGRLLAKRGDAMAGVRLLRACLDGLRGSRYENIYTAFLSNLAEILAIAGDLAESIAAADEALRRTERNNALWRMPEALRVNGEVLLLSGNPDTTAAEDLFGRSLDLARRQGALSLELQTAISLGRLRHAQGRSREAHDLLHAVFNRFVEGFETADLQCARRLLDMWA